MPCGVGTECRFGYVSCVTAVLDHLLAFPTLFVAQFSPAGVVGWKAGSVNVVVVLASHRKM